MPNPYFSGRIPPELFEHIEKFRETSGESKTELLIAALSTYTNYQSPDKQIDNKANDIGDNVIDNKILIEIQEIKNRLTEAEKNIINQKNITKYFSQDLKAIESKINNFHTVINNDNIISNQLNIDNQPDNQPDNQLAIAFNNINPDDSQNDNEDDNSLDNKITKINGRINFNSADNLDRDFILSQGAMASRLEISSKELANYKKKGEYKIDKVIDNILHKVEYLGEGKIDNKLAQLWRCKIITLR